MECERLDSCVFFKTHRYMANTKQSELLVETYCEGDLHPKCRRNLYRQELGQEPPDDMAPNGYQVGSHKKIY